MMNAFVDRYALALVLAFCGVTLALFSGFNADDAYIVGRYAQNAADGAGLVYNRGEYVSAPTSPFHALFETILALFGLPPGGSYRAMAPAILAFFLVRAIKTTKMTRNELLFFTFFSIASPFMLIWSVGGLETPLLAAWVTANLF